MSGRLDPTTQGGGHTRPMVRVKPHRGGGWEIALPDEHEHVVCNTLNDATREAYQFAARRRPCELIVFDAYHRVSHRELVNGGPSAAPRKTPV